MVLSKMKETAESYLGTKVTHAVVTVPAYFNDAQRKATKDAGTIAGLNVMRIINEPTAAAIAYGIDKNKETEMNVLVYDLGGGTFDVSILTVDGGVFEVKATNGITHLGGEDFDVNLAKELARRFKKKTGVSLMTDKRAYSKLKRESERAKRSLSSQHSVKVEIEDIVKGRNLEETVTRAEFEQLNMKLFRETLKPVRTVLADAKMKKKNIDEVVLVGGSTRIPAVQKLLGEFFEGKKLHKEINPDEAIAYGAAVQAVILSGAKNEETKDLLLLDVTPLSLGIETVGGVHTKVITKNTPIPTSKAQTFTTNENDQTSVTITVYQGESRMVKSSHRIGHFELSGIEKAPRGVPQIEVTFEIDANGILLVTAKDKASGKNNKLKIDEAMTGANSEEVKRMKENFEKYKEEDERTFNRTVAKNKLDASLHRAEDYKKKNEKKLSEADLDDLESFVNEMREWNNGADVADTETKEFEEKTKEVEEMLQDLDSGEGEAGGEPVEEEEEEEESEENDNKKEL